MFYEIVEPMEANGEWRVEAIGYDGDGKKHVTTFSGPNAEADARQYAQRKISEKRCSHIVPSGIPLTEVSGREWYGR